MAVSCDRIFVEGATEKIILSNPGFNEDNIEVKFGKEEVIFVSDPQSLGFTGVTGHCPLHTPPPL